MNIAFLCVLLALVLIYVPRGVVFAVLARERGLKGFDNRTPRVQQATLEGFGARAQGAHLNGFEAFAPFAAAVICAHLAGVDPSWLNGLSIAFVALRSLYLVCYLADIDTVRSTVWSMGLGVVVTLFVFAVIGFGAVG